MITIQKYLQESIFDKKLASKDTGLEYLYGLVDYATVNSYAYIDYLDTKKIKHDFNELSKKFEMKPWNANKWLTMDKFQKIETNELLRELLYIIVTKVESVETININKLQKTIEKIIEDYADLSINNRLEIHIFSNNQRTTIYIKFYKFYDNITPSSERVAPYGKIEIQLRQI